MSDAESSDSEVSDGDEENLPTKGLTTELPSDNETEGGTPACPVLSTSKQRSLPQVFDWQKEDRCFVEPARGPSVGPMKYFQVFLG